MDLSSPLCRISLFLRCIALARAPIWLCLGTKTQ